jgi:hypothetical protein
MVNALQCVLLLFGAASPPSVWATRLVGAVADTGSAVIRAGIRHPRPHLMILKPLLPFARPVRAALRGLLDQSR